jgi:hypothetical protein
MRQLSVLSAQPITLALQLLIAPSKIFELATEALNVILTNWECRALSHPVPWQITSNGARRSPSRKRSIYMGIPR